MITANPFSIIISFILAIILSIIPLPDIIVWLRPDFALLIIIFWLITVPYSIGFLGISIIGIILDVLHGTLFGEHAFALIIVSYFIIANARSIALLEIVQQTFIVGCICFLYRLIIYGIQYIVGIEPHGFAYWSSILIAMIIWPFLLPTIRSLFYNDKLA